MSRLANESLFERQMMESLVMVNEEPHKLRFLSVIRVLSLRSKPLSTDEGNEEYVEGLDFVVDYAGGTVRRTKESRIPNWADHVLYGKSDFDHRDYNDCGNLRYTVWIDYEYRPDGGAWGIPTDPSFCKLKHVPEKLGGGQPVRYFVFGDSISAGGEASREAFTFYRRFAEDLLNFSAQSELSVINRSIGGETSSAGLERLERDILAAEPDLISIGYGMNDQCRDAKVRNFVPPELFERNISEMVKRIRMRTNAEIILVTPCISNPLWKHSSGDLAVYAHVIRNIARRQQVCIADVYAHWIKELQAGKTHESLLLNNINHPNDYGHRIYYQAFRPLIR